MAKKQVSRNGISRTSAPTFVRVLAWLFAGTILALTVAGGALTVIYSVGLVRSEPRMEIGAGRCFYNQKGVGGWWLGEGYAHDPMRATCGEVALANLDIAHGARSSGWRLAYVDLGRPRLHEVAWGGAGVQPHWTATGEGEFRGVSFGAITEWPGTWTPSLEAGIFAYRSQWRVDAEHHASGKINSFTSPASHRATIYVGGARAYSITKQLALYAGVHIYPRLRSSNYESGGDTVGPKYATVLALTTGARWEFR